jgi:hypothetical protein
MSWVAEISKEVFHKERKGNTYHPREWDFILDYNGTIENVGKVVDPTDFESPVKDYPPRYRLPLNLENFATSTEEHIQRQELFALGGIFYHILFGRELFYTISDAEGVAEMFKARFLRGEFPEDVWQIPMASVVLGCWSPEFATKYNETKYQGIRSI